MERNIMRQSNELSDVLITYEIQRNLKNIGSNRKFTETEITIERKILSVAKNYENGVFEKCDYIKPNEAYECIRYIAEHNRKSSIIEYIYELENEINRIIAGEIYNELMMEEYIKCLAQFIEIKFEKESEFKRCGREYELFDF